MHPFLGLRLGDTVLIAKEAFLLDCLNKWGSFRPFNTDVILQFRLRLFRRGSIYYDLFDWRFWPDASGSRNSVMDFALSQYLPDNYVASARHVSQILLLGSSLRRVLEYHEPPSCSNISMFHGISPMPRLFFTKGNVILAVPRLITAALDHLDLNLAWINEPSHSEILTITLTEISEEGSAMVSHGRRAGKCRGAGQSG